MLLELRNFDKELFVDCCDYSPGSAIVTEFAMIDALPGAKIQTTVSDRDSKAHSKER